MKRATTVLALGLAMLAASAANAAPPAPVRPGPDTGVLSRAGKWIVDDQGRVVIVHGFNIMIKGSPFYPANFTDQDAKFLADEGFTAARLGWIWEGAEPNPGHYDDAYIKKIADLDALMGKYGIRTLVDAHHDQYSRAAFGGVGGILGGDGAPAWAMQGSGADGGFQHFWNDDKAADGIGIQTHFVNTWKRMAAALADHRNVLGFDPLNEPYPGSGYPAPCGDFAACPAFEQGALAAFYRRAIAAIRASNPRRLIFPEGIAQNAKAPTSLPTFGDPEMGFNWHYYCTESQLVNPDPSPVTAAACSDTDAAAHATFLADMAARGEPYFISEWGSADADGEYQKQVDWMGSQFASWTEWSYYQDLTGGGNLPNQGLLIDESQPGSEQNAKQLKLDALVVPYPQATAGTPSSYDYNRTTNTLHYSYTTTPATNHVCPTAPTQIFVPWRKYPLGYQVTATGAKVISDPGSAWVELVNEPGASTVTVTISNPGATVPPVPTQMPSQTLATAPANIHLC